jgi:tetratricopeptide (TPR) repeat protein
MKHLICIVLLTLVLSGSTGIGAQEIEMRDDPPLGVQLEGLAPEARIAYLGFLIRSGKDDAEIYFQLGVAFHESSEPDSAEYYYLQAIEASPDLSKAYVNLAVLYDDQGKKTEALGKFEEAIAINPEDLLALSHAALMNFQIKQHGRASDYISRAIATDPEHPQPHFYLAIFFWESGMYREAVREWQMVVDLDPDSRLAMRARENITLVQNAMRNAVDN